MLKRFLLLSVLGLASLPARAEDFDYFVLALTWTPTFCEMEGEDRAREQCDPRRDLGFTLHGLWPQYDAGGWPEYCTTSERDPSRRETAAMADIMGSGGLAWHQWKKHGRCTGFESDFYFTASRLAYENLTLPRIRETRIKAQEVEDAFIAANKGLTRDNVVVTCAGDLVREVRICLDQILQPRECAPDVLRSACRYRGDLDLPPIR